VGIVAAFVVLGATILAAGPLLQARFGLELSPWPGTADEFRLSMAVLAAGILACLLPAWRATRLSLADGLTPRL
jgi:putative ABC transport system permease protein